MSKSMSMPEGKSRLPSARSFVVFETVRFLAGKATKKHLRTAVEFYQLCVEAAEGDGIQ